MSGSLVEEVQPMGDLIQLGITVPHLALSFINVRVQIRNLILYLEKHHKKGQVQLLCGW